MSSLFLRISVRLKLIFFFSIIFLLYATFNFLYYPEIHKKQALNYTKTHLHNMAETVALSTGISMKLLDFLSIGVAINWAKEDPNLIYLGIFDAENEEIGIFNPNKLEVNIADALTRKGFFEVDGDVYTVVPINYAKSYRGKVIIGVSLNKLNADIQKNKETTFYISTGILLFGILISILISNLISKPLNQLTKATREVGKGNYDIDVNVKSSDEIGLLARAFQIMTDKIDRTMAENAQITKQLEEIIVDLTEMGTSLSAEKDLDKLLEMIVSKAQHLAYADSGTLYLVEGNKLIFKIVRNDTLDIALGGKKGDDIPFAPVDVAESNISGYVALNKEYLNIPDIYSSEEYDLEGPRAFDRKYQYKTRSMLVLPLLNLENETVGVLQLINSKDQKTSDVVPFPASVEKLALSLASQAAVAITNLLLKEGTEVLLQEVTNIKNYNESILESMTNGVITLDSQNRIIKCNAVSLRTFNSTAEDLTGRLAEECFANGDQWLIESFQKVMKTGRPEITPDQEFRGKNGATIFANITISPLKDVKKELIGTVVVFDDITAEKRIKGTLAKFMTKEVADKILEDAENLLGGQLQEAAILFSDIRGFTSIAEGLSPQHTVEMLNEYFDIMVDVVFKNSGILDKFIGDAILAVYGIPFKGPMDSEHAVMTSIEMIRALKTFNQDRVKKNKTPIFIRIGINTAEVLAGNIGSIKRMDYTIIGDGVNLASRIEGLNKVFGTQILISGNTYSIVKDKFPFREIDLIKVKGKDEAVSIYEVIDFENEGSSLKFNKLIRSFEDGVNFYRDRKWERGLKKFNEILSCNPDDDVSRVYLDRCKNMMENPPDNNWDAVWVMDSK